MSSSQVASLDCPFVLSIDKPCSVDELADVEQSGNACAGEPIRKINPCRQTTVAAPPRRFHRTFWRGLVGRALKKLDRIQCRQTNDKAVPVKIVSQENSCDEREFTLGNAY